MKNKDIKLFNEAIHKAKYIIGDLHKDITSLKEIIDELYELFEDFDKEKNGGNKND